MLLCLLVAAEAMAVVHSLDFDAHTVEEPCKICISIAGFGGAPPARAVTLLPPAAAASDRVEEIRIVELDPVEQPVARGPPRVS